MSTSKTSAFFFVLAALLFTRCHSSRNSTGTRFYPQATIVKEGFIDCFEKGLSANGQPVWCEASAIVYDGKKLLLANDKDMPGPISSVFYRSLQNNLIDTTGSSAYLTNALLKKGTKYEDFAQTPDGKYILLSTAFDRVKPGSTNWDNFNTILYWKNGDENHPRILRINGATDSSSVSIRPLLTAAMASPLFPQGPPYFKIEGLAVTGKLLYFGIREEGKSYSDFSYKIKILTLPYSIQNDSLHITGGCTVLADFNIDSLRPGKDTIAISSMEYDPFSKRFLILTSHEGNGNLGGYLWTATEKDLQQRRMNLVKDAAGQPIHFRHKSEDLAIINKKRIIVIHDDDRETLPVNGQTRQPYQAAYSIVDFK